MDLVDNVIIFFSAFKMHLPSIESGHKRTFTAQAQYSGTIDTLNVNLKHLEILFILVVFVSFSFDGHRSLCEGDLMESLFTKVDTISLYRTQSGIHITFPGHLNDSIMQSVYN